PPPVIRQSQSHVRPSHAMYSKLKQDDGVETGSTGSTPTTPQCALCEMYPTTAYNYSAHRHKSTLAQNGIYLNCSCGLKVTSQSKNSKYIKEVHSYSVHSAQA
ncbi:hypothetical protein PENTCL1PPCAC_19799, partial [Pristionchus entomophagus]